MKIDRTFGDIKIPRNLVQRVQGDLFNQGIQARIAAQGKNAISYRDALKAEMEANPEAASLYTDGPQPGIDYYLSGSGARELIASLKV